MDSNTFNIGEELKKLPSRPGVYIMHDEKDNIIYVGKAISLKNRVRQYFQNNRNHSSKIVNMVKRVAYFEYIVTDSEMEALILECNLIKEHTPKYNTMLKDGKSYPYIKVTVNEEYPRVLFARNQKKDKAKYFGPFTNVTAVKDTLELIKKVYEVRSCSKSLPKEIGKTRPCLNYHIKQCKAPCMGYISKEEYAKIIDEIIDFLNGNYTTVAKKVEDRMKQAAEKMEFEDAARYRDILESLKHIVQKQKINNNENQDDKDVIACAIEKNDAVVQIFFFRQGKLLGREHFHMTIADNCDSNEKLEVLRADVLSSFVKQYYSGTPYIPKTIMLQVLVEDNDVLEEWLTRTRGSRVHIVVPKKGEKEKMIELACQNAEIVLKQDTDKIKKEELRTKGAVNEICRLINVENVVRIESYDISNISGFLSVGSMVVYENGRPKKNDYRKFRIKSVVGSDDYASMQEVLTRRFKHGMREEGEATSFTRYPDLILMDGGRGQVNIALKVLDELGFDIPVCGMVKDDNHRTRGLYFNNLEIPIDRSSEGFKLITRIQDETHRFAIEYHRSLRSKEQIHSVLDDIKGVGATRRKALMKYFKSIEDIKNSSVEELSKVPNIDNRTANAIFDFFANNCADQNNNEVE